MGCIFVGINSTGYLLKEKPVERNSKNEVLHFCFTSSHSLPFPNFNWSEKWPENAWGLQLQITFLLLFSFHYYKWNTFLSSSDNSTALSSKKTENVKQFAEFFMVLLVGNSGFGVWFGLVLLRVGPIIKMLKFFNPSCGGTSGGHIPNLRSLRPKMADLNGFEFTNWADLPNSNFQPPVLWGRNFKSV